VAGTRTRTLRHVTSLPPVDEDHRHMLRAVELAAGVRTTTSPNPWVGCVLLAADGRIAEGATHPPGGPHAEAAALATASEQDIDPAGATVYVTLEPCSHHGRTPPCADALVAAGVARVVVGAVDPDPRVGGSGLARLRDAGVEVTAGVAADIVADQLAPYLTHRTTGRPHVVLKLAASLDGRTAAPDGTSRWITGEAARADAHRLRAESDAILVGAGTVRADDPELTVRHVQGRDPLRVVLGHIPPGARVLPAVEMGGDLGDVLDELGRRDVVQLLVEGGASVAGDFHRAGLVDAYVVYLAPVLFAGDDAPGLFSGPGAATMSEVWRGRITRVTTLGDDIRVDLHPPRK
jgi:diaminohydroxyphosphoribosylaminopyrimidine deaminase/5-amino-6-(5-phosphoribosylamino)uracil reductase